MAAIIFASHKDAVRLRKAAQLPVVHGDMSKHEIAEKLTEFNSGLFSVLVCTYSIGMYWGVYAPETEVFFLEGFPDNAALRVQCEARVKRHSPNAR